MRQAPGDLVEVMVGGFDNGDLKPRFGCLWGAEDVGEPCTVCGVQHLASRCQMLLHEPHEAPAHAQHRRRRAASILAPQQRWRRRLVGVQYVHLSETGSEAVLKGAILWIESVGQVIVKTVQCRYQGVLHVHTISLLTRMEHMCVESLIRENTHVPLERDSSMGPIAGVMLCMILGVARPLHAAKQTLKSQDLPWLAFFVCTSIFVLPLALLPMWIPLRYEVMVGLLLVFGASDGRGSLLVFRRYVAPVLARIPELTWPEDMDAWFAAFEYGATCLQRAPYPSSPTKDAIESEDGNDGADLPQYEEQAKEVGDGFNDTGILQPLPTLDEELEAEMTIPEVESETEVEEERTTSSPHGSSTRMRPRAGMKT